MSYMNTWCHGLTCDNFAAFSFWKFYANFKDWEVSMTHYLCKVWQFIPVIVLYENFQEFICWCTVAGWLLRKIQNRFHISMIVPHFFSLFHVDHFRKYSRHRHHVICVKYTIGDEEEVHHSATKFSTPTKHDWMHRNWYL